MGKDLLNTSSLKQILGGRNIYLVGMMGSGKTTTGPYLAKALDYGFVDSDTTVEKVAKMSISQIFEIDGEATFRDIETQVLKEIGKRYSLVVSTGGGIVTSSQNWGTLHQGIVVWIDPDKEIILERLSKESEKRPLLRGKSSSDILDFCEMRNNFYKEADLHIRSHNQSPKELASLIIEKLSSIVISEENQDG